MGLKTALSPSTATAIDGSYSRFGRPSLRIAYPKKLSTNLDRDLRWLASVMCIGRSLWQATRSLVSLASRATLELVFHQIIGCIPCANCISGRWRSPSPATNDINGTRPHYLLRPTLVGRPKSGLFCYVAKAGALFTDGCISSMSEP